MVCVREGNGFFVQVEGSHFSIVFPISSPSGFEGYLYYPINRATKLATCTVPSPVFRSWYQHITTVLDDRSLDNLN